MYQNKYVSKYKHVKIQHTVYIKCTFRYMSWFKNRAAQMDKSCSNPLEAFKFSPPLLCSPLCRVSRWQNSYCYLLMLLKYISTSLVSPAVTDLNAPFKSTPVGKHPPPDGTCVTRKPVGLAVSWTPAVQRGPKFVVDKLINTPAVSETLCRSAFIFIQALLSSNAPVTYSGVQRLFKCKKDIFKLKVMRVKSSDAELHI